MILHYHLTWKTLRQQMAFHKVYKNKYTKDATKYFVGSVVIFDIVIYMVCIYYL